MANNMTIEDIERMRELVRAFDGQGSKIKEFDLNNPPQAPYRYQEFPRVVYHHAERTMTKVHSTDELDQHLATGYSVEPYAAVAADHAPPPLEPAIAREAAAIDAQLVKRARK
ncbi:MAG TPA: hypothetical protein VN803_08040 [Gemmatimonadales bacterium]|nr:hypothetical protein [Gemmatimonadales bacterium]